MGSLVFQKILHSILVFSPMLQSMPAVVSLVFHKLLHSVLVISLVLQTFPLVFSLVLHSHCVELAAILAPMCNTRESTGETNHNTGPAVCLVFAFTCHLLILAGHSCKQFASCSPLLATAPALHSLFHGFSLLILCFMVKTTSRNIKVSC